jgi:hypothetical protein
MSPLKMGDELRCSGRVNSFCATIDIGSVTHIKTSDDKLHSVTSRELVNKCEIVVTP